LSTAVAYSSLSKDYSGLGDHKKAMKYADSSLAISLKEGYKERLSRIYLRKSIINRATKDFESAYNNYRKYKAYSDSVHDINYIKKI
jgi:tetratricopeptide (TPR) repeat protein